MSKAPCETIRATGFERHILPCDVEKQEKLRIRAAKYGVGVVDACHPWFNLFWRPVIRYDKLGAPIWRFAP